jgi:hypothetical protein
MNTLEDLRSAIASIFAEWEKLPRIGKDWRISAAMDKERDQYALQFVDLKEDKFHSSTLAHLEIRSGKIWILTDNTEDGIGNELVALGVPKDKIVLAFYPPAMREMGEFAVA